jgi:hypothetical protein
VQDQEQGRGQDREQGQEQGDVLDDLGGARRRAFSRGATQTDVDHLRGLEARAGQSKIRSMSMIGSMSKIRGRVPMTMSGSIEAAGRGFAPPPWG